MPATTKIQPLGTALANPQWEAFCQKFVFDNRCRYNAARSYLAVYPGCRDLTVARSAAPELLATVSVRTRIRELLESAGFNDEAVDGRLNDHIQQDQDRAVSVSAIREYNRLKKRVDDAPKLQTNVVSLLLDLMKDDRGDAEQPVRPITAAEDEAGHEPVPAGSPEKAVEVLEG